MDDELSLPTIFQNWQSLPVRAGVSFDTAGEAEEPASRWSLDLPADPSAAAETMTQAEAQLRAAQAALEAAPQRLEEFVSRMQSGEVDFAVGAAAGDGGGAPPAEAVLLPFLDSLQPGRASFGLRDEVGELVERFQENTRGLLDGVQHLASVETRMEGELLARTLVDWTGDQVTAWEVALTPEQRSLHERSLAMALASRFAMIRMVSIAAQGAAKIATLIAAPGGALLALPAAWKYLNMLMSQMQKSES